MQTVVEEVVDAPEVGAVVLPGKFDCNHQFSIAPWDSERLGERVTGLNDELATHRYLWKCRDCREERLVEFQVPLDH